MALRSMSFGGLPHDSMHGCLAIVLHAHLPFVRHAECERFFEESWLFEALIGCYLPLVRLLATWERERMHAPVTLSISPTLCEMLADPLLQSRMLRRLEALARLAERETDRTFLEPDFQELASMYRDRFCAQLDFFKSVDGRLLPVFKGFQERGRLELMTTSATHAILPLLLQSPGSLHAQLVVARDTHLRHFGVAPKGIWLPECAYDPAIETELASAGFRWFIVDSHGLLNGNPRPVRGVQAPVVTRNGLAVFGRDPESAQQVWSRESGYPGDRRYRDFYRDIGYDLEFDYVSDCFPHPHERGFTGIKYHSISEGKDGKEVYRRSAALHAVHLHAAHFFQSRVRSLQSSKIEGLAPPILVCPYDAELFGHWWFEGPDFLDSVARHAASETSPLRLVTPDSYLRIHATHQLIQPAASSWGEGGHLKVWLDESNGWMRVYLEAAQRRMCELAGSGDGGDQLMMRALNQAGRELLLAQASDWPFMIRNKTSLHYAKKRFTLHLSRFEELTAQVAGGRIQESVLSELEESDNLFPGLNSYYWSVPSS